MEIKFKPEETHIDPNTGIDTDVQNANIKKLCTQYHTEDIPKTIRQIALSSYNPMGVLAQMRHALSRVNKK